MSLITRSLNITKRSQKEKKTGENKNFRAWEGRDENLKQPQLLIDNHSNLIKITRGYDRRTNDKKISIENKCSKTNRLENISIGKTGSDKKDRKFQKKASV
jgi:hypothetical protein